MADDLIAAATAASVVAGLLVLLGEEVVLHLRQHCGPNCLLCYANRKARSNYKGHWGFRPMPKLRRMPHMGFVKKAAAHAVVNASLGDWEDEGFKAMYPAIFEHLSLTSYEDGSKRVPSSLTFFQEEGRIKVCLSDKDNQRMGFVTADTFQTVLAALEAQLEAGTVDWRASKPAAGGGRKRQ